jgi:hypothetical protein
MEHSVQETKLLARLWELSIGIAVQEGIADGAGRGSANKARQSLRTHQLFAAFFLSGATFVGRREGVIAFDGGVNRTALLRSFLTQSPCA